MITRRTFFYWGTALIAVGLAITAIFFARSPAGATRQTIASLGIDQGIDVPITEIGEPLGSSANLIALNIVAGNNATTRASMNATGQGSVQYVADPAQASPGEKPLAVLHQTLQQITSKGSNAPVRITPGPSTSLDPGVILTAAANTPFEAISSVMIECSRGGIRYFEFATRPSPGAELHFVKSDIPLAMPNGKPVEDIAATFNIHIRSDSAPDGTPTFKAEIAQGSFGTKDALLAGLKTQLQMYIATGIKPEKIAVVIYPDRETRYDHILLCYELAIKAGFKHIAFGVSN